MNKTAMWLIFCALILIFTQSLCYRIDQGTKTPVSESLSVVGFEPYDLTYSELWPVQKWKIRNRKLKTKKEM